MLDSTRLRDVQRATDTLKGILAGISCDYELSDVEIGRLYDWLHIHAHLLNIEPFQSAKKLIESALADSVITDDEREDLLVFCQKWSDFQSEEFNVQTVAMRHLHGFLEGLSADGDVSDSEILDFHDWLHSFEDLHETWPFSNAVKLIKKILKDNKVSTAERARMLDFCLDFRPELALDKSPETYDPVSEGYMITNAPVLKTVKSIFDADQPIEFRERIFCFTGQARYGKRKDLEAVVQEVGGRTHPRIVADLDYLVVGALSQPCWAYEVYGRKIENVMELRKRGCQIWIIHEDRFLNALQDLARTLR